MIHNGVSVVELERDAASGLSRETGSGFVVGTAGRLETVKGLEDFLRAAARLDRDDIRFMIVGDGPDRGRLERIARESGVEDRIEFCGYSPNLAGELATMDVFVMPSLTEGFGLVAAEAMALEKPVVASDVGGLAEVVEDGLTGILVPPGDPKALASAIGRLLDDSAARRSMGEAGRRRVLEHFAAKRMVEEHLSVYGELLGRQVGD
jgi:glycosyltransferase involved in cell wall biosynthesis